MGQSLLLGAEDSGYRQAWLLELWGLGGGGWHEIEFGHGV